MKLDELKPAQKRASKIRVGRGIGSGLGKEKHLEEVKKAKNQEQVVELDVDLKVVKHHYIEDYLREDSTIVDLQRITQR